MCVCVCVIVCVYVCLCVCACVFTCLTSNVFIANSFMQLLIIFAYVCLYSQARVCGMHV